MSEDKVLPEALIIDSLLLKEDELIVYTDERKEIHYLSNKPIVPNKKYNLIYIDHSKLVQK